MVISCSNVPLRPCKDLLFAYFIFLSLAKLEVAPIFLVKLCEESASSFCFVIFSFINVIVYSSHIPNIV